MHPLTNKIISASVDILGQQSETPAYFCTIEHKCLNQVIDNYMQEVAAKFFDPAVLNALCPIDPAYNRANHEALINEILGANISLHQELKQAFELQLKSHQNVSPDDVATLAVSILEQRGLI